MLVSSHNAGIPLVADTRGDTKTEAATGRRSVYPAPHCSNHTVTPSKGRADDPLSHANPDRLLSNQLRQIVRNK